MRGLMLVMLLLLGGALCAQKEYKWGENLNTAKDADYLSPQERDVIFEMNSSLLPYQIKA